MTFFSRCDAPQCFEPSPRSAGPRRARASARQDGPSFALPAARPAALVALSAFFEDVGILARYALGLDYYGRDRMGAKR